MGGFLRHATGKAACLAQGQHDLQRDVKVAHLGLGSAKTKRYQLNLRETCLQLPQMLTVNGKIIKAYHGRPFEEQKRDHMKIILKTYFNRGCVYCFRAVELWKNGG